MSATLRVAALSLLEEWTKAVSAADGESLCIEHRHHVIKLCFGVLMSGDDLASVDSDTDDVMDYRAVSVASSLRILHTFFPTVLTLPNLILELVRRAFMLLTTSRDQLQSTTLRYAALDLLLHFTIGHLSPSIIRHAIGAVSSTSKSEDSTCTSSLRARIDHLTMLHEYFYAKVVNGNGVEALTQFDDLCRRAMVVYRRRHGLGDAEELPQTFLPIDVDERHERDGK